MRRPSRTLVFVLIAAQLLLSVPVVSAANAQAPADTAMMDCAGEMPTGDSSTHCPCCPEGAGTLSACVTACAAPAATAMLLTVTAAPATANAVPQTEFVSLPAFAEPPLKPPQIG